MCNPDPSSGFRDAGGPRNGLAAKLINLQESINELQQLLVEISDQLKGTNEPPKPPEK